MGWVIAVIVVLALLVGGFAVWFVAPTMRTFRGPRFEPSPRDAESVLRVNESGMVDGGQ